MPQLRLAVTSMRCRHCVRDVTARLRDVPGVTMVMADAASSTVELEGTMSVADVEAALRNTSYVVTVLS